MGSDTDVEYKVDIVENKAPFELEDSTNSDKPVDAFTQTKSKSAFLSARKFADNNKAFLFYTGLKNFGKFLFVLSTLGPAAYHLNYIWRPCEMLSVEDQFFLTLVKLRTNKTNFELSLSFNVPEYTVSNTFITWVNFMYHQWKEIDIWPSCDLVRYFMPEDFKKKFPKTRIIIDGMERPVMKPKSATAQQSTFSSYKNRNTVKVLVGCAPSGLVTFLSPTYGGSTSDRQCEKRIFNVIQAMKL